MLKYLVPKIELGDLRPMFAVTLIGSMLAGAYGILHDQITYSISPEYFTNLKFDQFHYADFGLGDRVFVSFVGFLATWWVGLIIAWFLARRLIPNQPRKIAYRRIFVGFSIVFGCGIVAGSIGYFYGLWCGPEFDYSAWSTIIRGYEISDTWAFVRVAYIHNASYLGGAVGLILSLIVMKPKLLEC